MSRSPTRRHPFGWLGRRLHRLMAREDGTSTVEFVIILPVIMLIFTGAFEAGMLETRYVLLDRSLDIAVRELRLGQIPSPTHDKLKQEICKRAWAIPDCMNSVLLELRPIDTSNWSGIDTAATCLDRSEDIKTQDPPNFNAGGDDQLMLVRACAVLDPLFPTTSLGLRMQKDATGAYHLVATSAFVNEPS